MRTKRAEHSWEHGTERLHVAEQYANKPQHGLVVSVKQRTTGSGRAILLTPAQVTELHRWLGEWLGNPDEVAEDESVHALGRLPGTEHLAIDAPSQRCGRCMRYTWARGEFDSQCRMTQPDGFPCGGRFSDHG